MFESFKHRSVTFSHDPRFLHILISSESFALVHLNRTPGLDPLRIHNLVKVFGSAQACLSKTASLWETEAKVPRQIADSSLSFSGFKKSEAEIQRCHNEGIRILTWSDADYPEALQFLDARPPALYVQGEISPIPAAAHSLAVVGSRAPTEYGRVQAGRFAYSLASQGLLIVSGLARGIDSAAHQGALDAGGKTIAVLGSGLLNPYPPGNHDLLRKIQTHGWLLSEFPLEEPAHKRNFPRRNRILAGLACGVLVVEAAEKSGSLITAHWAMDQGREVFAMPGRVDNPMSRGCHSLIREGAYLVQSPSEILDLLSIQSATDSETSSPSQPSTLLQALGDSIKSIDELSLELNQSPEKILQELLELEIEGTVVRGPGGLYRKGTKGRYFL